MSRGQIGNTALKRTNEVPNAFGRLFDGSFFDLKKFRHSHPDDFRGFSFHEFSLVPQGITQLTWKSDGNLIFHGCILLHCNALRNERSDCSVRARLDWLFHCAMIPGLCRKRKPSRRTW
jgi:hypothetical protein